MPDYKKMYLHLFNVVSCALQSLEHRDYGIAEDLLKKGQAECEEIYMDKE